MAEEKVMSSQKIGETMAFIAGARGFAPDIGHAPRAPTLQSLQKLWSAAQRHRWAFYETSSAPQRINGNNGHDDHSQITICRAMGNPPCSTHFAKWR